MASVALMTSRATKSSSSREQQQHLPTALQLHVLSFLPPNDRALSGRLAFREANDALSKDPSCVASLSQPLPVHAEAWAVQAGQQHVHSLAFQRKLGLLSTAAASGSEVNLEVALALLQPSIFPEMLLPGHTFRNGINNPAPPNPGVVAVKAGHLHLLGWLQRHCPSLASAPGVLEAAAEHCDLAGLQEVWGLMSVEPNQHMWVLEAAAGSATPDAVAKLEWLMAVPGSTSRLQGSTAAAAARAGNLGVLQWLKGRGCAMATVGPLQAALQHAGLAIAQWLVDEGGCRLPGPGARGTWEQLLDRAAQGPDGVAKLQWLLGRGAPPLDSEADKGRITTLALSAAFSGQVEVVRYLLAVHGPATVLALPDAAAHMAAHSGSIPVVECLLEAGLRFSSNAYKGAAEAGSVAMVRWLAQVARAPIGDLDICSSFVCEWPRGTAANRRGLMEAVQLLVGEVGLGGRVWTVDKVVATAAGHGDVALMRYLLQQKPVLQEPDGVTLVSVACLGSLALLEWLAAEYPACLGGGWGSVSPYRWPAESGDRGTLTALERLGVPMVPQMSVPQAVALGCEAPVLRWLAERGAPVGSEEDMEGALAQRRPANWGDSGEAADVRRCVEALRAAGREA